MANTYPVTVIKPFDQREIDAIAAPFVDMANTIKTKKDALTAKQTAIRNREATIRQRAYEGLDSIKGIDYATYDSNMREFFDGKVDDYVTIANGIDAGTVNAKEGARSLSYISNMIDEYQTLAPKVLAQAKFMMENGAGGNNTLSKLNDPNLEIMFSKLLEGSGEVTLAEDGNGKMYLKGAGTLDGEDWDYNLNLSEFDKLDAEGESLAITTIDNEELGLDTIGETASATATKEEAKNNGTTMEYTNVDIMRKNLYGTFSNAVDKMITNPDFNSYWADEIYEGENVDYLTDNNMLWDAADETKQADAKKYLIEQMISNIPLEQQVKFSETNEDGSPDATSAIVGVDESSTWGTNALVAPRTPKDNEARNTASIYVNDPIGSMRATEKSEDYLKVTQNGSIITVAFGNETDKDEEGKLIPPEIKPYDLKKRDEFIAYFQKIRERNKRFEGLAQDSQKRKEQFVQELKLAYIKYNQQFQEEEDTDEDTPSSDTLVGVLDPLNS